LASGSAATVTIIVSAPSSAQSISATAAVTGDQPDPDASNNSAVASTTVIDVLAVSIITPNSGKPVGGNTVTISGSGFISITGVTFGGASATSVNVLSITSIEATAPSASEGAVDVVVSRSSGDVSDSVTVSSGYTYASADLVVTQAASPTRVQINENFTYTVTVTNNGPDDATTVTVTDTLPGGVTFVSADAGCSGSSGTVTCTVSSLADGASAAFEIVVTAPSTGQFISNTATVAAASPADSASGNNSVTLQTTVLASNLSIAITASPTSPIVSENFTYTVTVANNGPGDATTVTVTNTLPAGVTFVSADAGCSESGGTVTCTVSSLADGVSAAFDIVVTAPSSGGSISNAVSVAAASPAVNVSSNNAYTLDTTVRTSADLAITQAASPHLAVVDQNFTYTVTVTNNGPLAATGVTVTDTQSPRVVFVSADAGCSESSGTVTCTVSSLANGASAAFDIVVTAPGTGGSLSNAVAVAAASPDDFVPGNNSSSMTTLVLLPVGVPGIATWGLGVLALMLGAAAFVMRRRRAAAF